LPTVFLASERQATFFRKGLRKDLAVCSLASSEAGGKNPIEYSHHIDTENLIFFPFAGDPSTIQWSYGAGKTAKGTQVLKQPNQLDKLK